VKKIGLLVLLTIIIGQTKVGKIICSHPFLFQKKLIKVIGIQLHFASLLRNGLAYF